VLNVSNRRRTKLIEILDFVERAVERHWPMGISLLRFQFLGARLAAVDFKQPSDLVPSSHV
jgi:hypothetical protein